MAMRSNQVFLQKDGEALASEPREKPGLSFGKKKDLVRRVRTRQQVYSPDQKTGRLRKKKKRKQTLRAGALQGFFIAGGRKKQNDGSRQRYGSVKKKDGMTLVQKDYVRFPETDSLLFLLKGVMWREELHRGVSFAKRGVGIQSSRQDFHDSEKETDIRAGEQYYNGGGGLHTFLGKESGKNPAKKKTQGKKANN